MKKMILCFTLCASAGLFAAENGFAHFDNGREEPEAVQFPDPDFNLPSSTASAASSSGSNSNFEGPFTNDGTSSSSSPNLEGPFADLSGINKALQAFKPFLKNPHVRIDVTNTQTETLNQNIRHEKDSRLNQFGDAMALYAGQTLSTLLVQDLYHAIKNYFIPNGEAAFQENVANLKLLQAENAEKERATNIQIMQEVRMLISTVRELNATATKRELTPAEQIQLNSATRSLSMLQGVMNASA